ncbi:MAG TPA: hypothetical protein VE084_04930 [Burkholderiaceae bacterium]|nr:hypothetical protein [Burkholderiaceae bacterium]
MQLLHELSASSVIATLPGNELSDDMRTSCRQDVSDLLALWVRTTPDNGSRIFETQETWLRECKDQNKVWDALHREVAAALHETLTDFSFGFFHDRLQMTHS